MQTVLLTSTDELAKIFRKWCRNAQDLRIVTAWATTDCALLDTLRNARGKISTLVVGLDFHSTSPPFLEEFWPRVRIGVAPNGGTFHPKLYLFRNGTAYCCIMGSSNFTGGGFGNNSELNVCIEGKVSEPFFKDVSKYIDLAEKESDRITSPIFEDYKSTYDAFSRARNSLAKFSASRTAKAREATRPAREQAGTEPIGQLNMSWPEFVREILRGSRRQHVVKNYMRTVETCRRSFEDHKKLSRMTPGERQYIGGTTETEDSGWFGSMKGAGRFKHLLNQKPKDLDAALDRIPRRGPVTDRQFSDFANRYVGEGKGVPTGSRLLAMKRPDLFICINSGNRAPVAKAVGMSASKLRNFDGYWELIQRIWSCPWYKAAQPQDKFRRCLWQARVALLDALYYLDGN